MDRIEKRCSGAEADLLGFNAELAIINDLHDFSEPVAASMSAASSCELCQQIEPCAECAGGSPIRSNSKLLAPSSRRDDGEPALWFVLRESEARRLVAAAENGRAHEVVDLLKLQPWWDEICAGVRGLRHLRPLDYVELSEGRRSAAK